MILELALWLTIGLLLSVVGYTFQDWQWWCLALTYWAVSMFSRSHGKVEGIIDFLEMSENDQIRLRKELQRIKEASK